MMDPQVWNEEGASPAAGDQSTGLPQTSNQAAEVLKAALGNDAGVPWRQARLMVRGRGGVGKSCTIDAMAGKTFDSQHQSTVGTGIHDLEVRHRELTSGASGALVAHSASGNEYALAVAAHAARLLKGQGDAVPQASMIDNLKQIAETAARRSRPPDSMSSGGALPPLPEEEAAASKANSAPASSAGPMGWLSSLLGGGDQTVSPAKEAVAPKSAVASTPRQSTRRRPSRKPSPREHSLPAASVAKNKAGKGSKVEKKMKTPRAAERAGGVSRKAAPTISPDLVIRYEKGELQQNLVLRVQDTGGQVRAYPSARDDVAHPSLRAAAHSTSSALAHSLYSVPTMHPRLSVRSPIARAACFPQHPRAAHHGHRHRLHGCILARASRPGQ